MFWSPWEGSARALASGRTGVARSGLDPFRLHNLRTFFQLGNEWAGETGSVRVGIGVCVGARGEKRFPKWIGYGSVVGVFARHDGENDGMRCEDVLNSCELAADANETIESRLARSTFEKKNSEARDREKANYCYTKHRYTTLVSRRLNPPQLLIALCSVRAVSSFINSSTIRS
jgi:hypothetical protein